MPEILQQPSDPDYLAREAGKKIYGTVVGSLRRTELYRLGNAWGMQFPIGATKDFMLPFFKNLEAQGKNPFSPPQSVPDKPTHSLDTHIDSAIVADAGVPEPKSEFETNLEKLQYWQLKKMCKERGITQSNKDRKQDLVARIMDASKGNEKCLTTS